MSLSDSNVAFLEEWEDAAFFPFFFCFCLYLALHNGQIFLFSILDEVFR